ncbi:MAG: cysteine dioxygenase [Cyclobacteriaceae bacterium]|jgi:cysteine dioxygenase
MQSVQELVTALSEEDSTKYTEIIKKIDLPSSAFEPFCSWSGESYTRNCIVENEKFELILICWEKGQNTPIHDHAGEECWVKIIQGEFKETIYKVDAAGTVDTVKSSISKVGDCSYMVDFMGCHRLENTHNQKSMSLHLYAKPIRSCRLFNEHTRKFERKELAYNTVSEMMTNSK